jgi:hypothetical protein
MMEIKVKVKLNSYSVTPRLIRSKKKGVRERR